MKTTRAKNENLSHLQHLGLTHNPFPVAPDDANFYMSDTIEEIIAEIVHGVCARKGFIMLTGGVGLGKTTITRHILQILADESVHTSLVFHTSLKDVALLKEINRDFGVVSDATQSGDQLGDHLQQLNEFLVQKFEQGVNCAIIIDDAQNLDRESLELLRMISNLEVDQQKIVQIILVGQTELITTLRSRDMRQLYSRIVICKVVRSLSRDELRTYLEFKLHSAGNQGRISLSQSAFRRIFKLTKGNFRYVNIFMDRCLYALCHNNCHRIDRKIVQAAQSDLAPEKKTATRRRFVLAASILLPLAVLGFSWKLHLSTTRDLNAAQYDDPTRYVVPLQAEPVEKRVESGMEKPVRSAIDPAIAAFLNIYQLDQYAIDFQKAIHDGALATLAQRIYGETGYQLIQLHTVPEDIRQRYGALAFSIGNNGVPTWLLFWQPQLELRRFYYAYRGDEIYELQKRLAKLHLYQYKVDGIVGNRLMQAVVRFQKQSGLPMTGFPDPVTLFWVCHQKTEVTHG